MVAQRFLYIGWSLQLCVGCLLFIISLFFEARVLSAFFQSAWVAWVLAVALETGKALAIVWYRLTTGLNCASFTLKLLSACFRAGLIIFSVTCTLLFLANYLDKPALKEAAAADQLELKQRHKNTTALQQTTSKLQQKLLVDRHQRNLADIDALYKPRIDALRDNLNLEMDNVIHGTFKGPRYREFERLLALELERHKLAIKEQTEGFDKQAVDIDSEANERREELLARQKEEVKALASRNYSLDGRANDPHVAAFINLIAEVFNTEIKPLQFVFYTQYSMAPP